MSKTISDCHLSLAYRLGESAVPQSTIELAKRLNWFKHAIELVCDTERPMWFLKTKGSDATIADTHTYAFPADWRQTIQIKVDGYKYDKIPADEVYKRYELPNSPVPILPAFMARSYYEFGTDYVMIPTPSSAPTAYPVTSITSVATLCTVTQTAHGYYSGEFVTIAGAVETAYNGKFEITVTGADTYTYVSGSTPASSPATGTITATKDNINIWYYKNPSLPSAVGSSIVIPDAYEDLIVSYAEGRYWSSAHKRGKSSDAFTEYETWVEKITKENIRHSFGEQET